ncbi:MAG: signal peptidase I [bacterium]|nr:signal peptidase I [Mycoplasmatota bacterium]MDD6757568.1 signal peptidase I [bacterium]MDY2907608.1 signal peptidase I [Candidatus Faecimonas sp.]
MLRKILDSKYFQIPYKIIKAIIFIVLLLYVVFTIIQRVSGNQSIFGYRLFAVATGSMVPDYNINDVLAIKEVNHNEIKVGDDITYLGKKQDVSGKIVTHRIIDIEEKNGKKTYLTKGINNDVEDPTIGDNQIYGKVVGKVPVVTQINHIVKNQYGFFFLIFLPLVIVIFLEIADTVTEMKQDKIEKDKKEDEVNENTEDEEEII